MCCTSMCKMEQDFFADNQNVHSNSQNTFKVSYLTVILCSFTLTSGNYHGQYITQKWLNTAVERNNRTVSILTQTRFIYIPFIKWSRESQTQNIHSAENNINRCNTWIHVSVLPFKEDMYNSVQYCSYLQTSKSMEWKNKIRSKP